MKLCFATFLVLVTAIFLPASANAEVPWPTLMVNATEAPDLQPDIDSARVYWRERGVIGCPVIPAYWADALKNLAGEPNVLGVGGSCYIGIRRTYYDRAWTSLERCTLVVHEVGHALDLEHNDPRFPVMSETPLEDAMLTECPAPVPSVIPPDAPLVSTRKSERPLLTNAKLRVLSRKVLARKFGKRWARGRVRLSCLTARRSCVYQLTYRGKRYHGRTTARLATNRWVVH